ncbi:MAG: universal stress protein UspA-like protein [Bacteroidetes bacterium]|nr:MAG: universal stress protein UspA-like protein [Bacteroidota bacterium]
MSESPKKILVPVDFEEQSLIAMEQGAHVAKLIGAEIVLLYVIEASGIISRFMSKQVDDDMRKEIEAKLDELVDQLKSKHGITATKMIARGSVYDKINEVSDMVNARMIVMGASGGTGLRRRFIGSNAFRVVREASIPVITIKGKHHRDGCKNIVLPLDLTKETREKVTKAIEYAKLYGADIRVVSVLFTTDEFIVNRLTRQLSQVKSVIEKAGLNVTAEIIKGIRGEGSLGEIVVDYANKVEGDLLLIMTQQEVDFTPAFVGSAAQEVINKSDIPVLSIVPTPKKDLTEFTPY